MWSVFFFTSTVTVAVTFTTFFGYFEKQTICLKWNLRHEQSRRWWRFWTVVCARFCCGCLWQVVACAVNVKTFGNGNKVNLLSTRPVLFRVYVKQQYVHHTKFVSRAHSYITSPAHLAYQMLLIFFFALTRGNKCDVTWQLFIIA